MEVLVVSKSDVTYFYISEILKKTEIKTIQANNLIEAKQILNSKLIDIVIIDPEMPDNSDGNEITKSIKLTHPDVPIIMLSCNLFPKTVIQSYLDGCNDYILKPFSEDNLYKAISKHCILEYM